METIKQLKQKKEELENQIFTRGWDKMGNNGELEKIEDKIKLTKEFVELIKELDLGIKTEYVILEKLIGEELIGRL